MIRSLMNIPRKLGWNGTRVQLFKQDTMTERIGEKLTVDQIVDDILKKARCPCCEEDQAILSGPSGGMSVNVACKYCGSRYNLTPVLGLLDWSHGPQSPTPMDAPATIFPEPSRVEMIRGLLNAR